MCPKIIKLAKIDKKIQAKDTDSLVVFNNKISSSRFVSGLQTKTIETKEKVKIKIIVPAGLKLKKPVYLCFGGQHQNLKQKIDLDIELKTDSSLSVLGFCIFPEDVKINHFMEAKIKIGVQAKFNYLEKHIHSLSGDISIKAKADVAVAEAGSFQTEFDLLTGRAGNLIYDYSVIGQTGAQIDVLSKIKGCKKDRIDIKEKIILEKKARGVVRSKIAVDDKAMARVFNTIIAKNAEAQGHIDCTEIMRGEAKAYAYPNIEVLHPEAKVTHEASLGGVDNKELETLMARGLSKAEAEDLIIKAFLS